MHFDQDSARCRIFTFKEGLLSKMAHDLELEVTRFSIDVDEALQRLSADVDATSLRVLHALQDGSPQPNALSSADKRKIEGQIARDVLHATRHPHVHFVSDSLRATPNGHAMSGTLTLHGVARTLQATSRRTGDREVLEFSLNQPDFGIRPFQAMLGALKVQAKVSVRVSVPVR